MNSTSIFRVTVRGRFSNLSVSARAALALARDEHDVTLAAFTSDGTLMYDDQLNAFSLRYEVRLDHDQSELVAGEIGLREAEIFLGTMGLTHGDLKASVTDMAALWGSRS